MGRWVCYNCRPIFDFQIMKIKTYKTRELKGLTLSLTIDNKCFPVEFKGGCTIGSTATYTTHDPDVQKAIESLKMYGNEYYLEKEIDIESESSEKVNAKSVEEPTPAPVQEEENDVVDVLDAKTFKNLVELRNALQDKGVDVSQITNVKAAESIAKKNGYNYTVEKKA